MLIFSKLFFLNKFKQLQEEYLPLAKDLFQSFSRDLSDFTAEDHNYTTQYKDLFWAKILEVETMKVEEYTLRKMLNRMHKSIENTDKDQEKKN